LGCGDGAGEITGKALGFVACTSNEVASCLNIRIVGIGGGLSESLGESLGGTLDLTTCLTGTVALCLCFGGTLDLATCLAGTVALSIGLWCWHGSSIDANC
jgi:hypothetical protein